MAVAAKGGKYFSYGQIGAYVGCAASYAGRTTCALKIEQRSVGTKKLKSERQLRERRLVPTELVTFALQKGSLRWVRSRLYMNECESQYFQQIEHE